MTRTLSIWLHFLTALGPVGCSSSAGTPTGGAAPTIASLSYSPSDAPAGVVTTITGKVAFEDVNADVSTLAIELRSPGATVPMKAPPSPVQAANLASGELAFFVQVAPPATGDYLLTVYVVDAKQNESNRLTGLVHVK